MSAHQRKSVQVEKLRDCDGSRYPKRTVGKNCMADGKEGYVVLHREASQQQTARRQEAV